MSDRNELPVMITHTEILIYAINHLGEMWKGEVEYAKSMEAKFPDFAKKRLTNNYWKKQLKGALLLYKLETGSDYFEKFDLLD